MADSRTMIEDIMSMRQTGTVSDYCNTFQEWFKRVQISKGFSEFYGIYLFIWGLEPKIGDVFDSWHQYSCNTVDEVISLALKIDANGLRDSFSPFDPESSFYKKELEWDTTITLDELMKDNEFFRNGKIQEMIIDEVIDDTKLEIINQQRLDVKDLVDISEYKVFDKMPNQIRDEIESQFSDIYICGAILSEIPEQKIVIQEVNEYEIDTFGFGWKPGWISSFLEGIDSQGFSTLENDMVNSNEKFHINFIRNVLQQLQGIVFGWKPGWILVDRTMNKELVVINTKKRWLMNMEVCGSLTTDDRYQVDLNNESSEKTQVCFVAADNKSGNTSLGRSEYMRIYVIQVVFSGFELHGLQELESVMSDLVMHPFGLLCSNLEGFSLSEDQSSNPLFSSESHEHRRSSVNEMTDMNPTFLNLCNQIRVCYQIRVIGLLIHVLASFLKDLSLNIEVAEVAVLVGVGSIGDERRWPKYGVDCGIDGDSCISDWVCHRKHGVGKRNGTYTGFDYGSHKGFGLKVVEADETGIGGKESENAYGILKTGQDVTAKDSLKTDGFGTQGSFGAVLVMNVLRDYNVLAMDVLGPSVEDLFKFCSRKFFLKTVLMIVHEVINRVEIIHSNCFTNSNVSSGLIYAIFLWVYNRESISGSALPTTNHGWSKVIGVKFETNNETSIVELRSIHITRIGMYNLHFMHCEPRLVEVSLRGSYHNFSRYSAFHTGRAAPESNLDTFNPHSLGKFDFKSELVSYREKVVDKVKQLNKDSKQWIWYKKRISKQERNSEALEDGFWLLSELQERNCGAASWGAYLLKRNIITMTFAPKVTREVKVSVALESGVPAIIGIMGSQGLRHPTREFNMDHCARFLITWIKYGELYILEVHRILSHGGCWRLSGPPIRREMLWKDWNRTPALHHEQDEGKELGCKELETYIRPLLEVSSLDGILGAIKKWPYRATLVSPRIKNNLVKGIMDKNLNKDCELLKDIAAALPKGKYSNTMDMTAYLGGFLAALKSQKHSVRVMRIAKLPLIDLKKDTRKEIKMRLQPLHYLLKIKDKDRGPLIINVTYHQFTKEEQDAAIEEAKKLFVEKKRLKVGGVMERTMDTIDGETRWVELVLVSWAHIFRKIMGVG